MAEIPWARRGSCVLAAVYLALIAVPQALGQETGSRDLSGALLCADQDAADEVVRTLSDADTEIVVRRLVVMLTSEGCRQVFGPQRYDVAKVEPSGVLEIYLRRTTGYVVPLAPTDH
jgi:hypothetical protein